MREIKFRSKRIDNGEWVYGDLVQLSDGRVYIINNIHGACIDNLGNFINTEFPFVCEVAPSTVGQYTELKDKNGVEIYEGDVLYHHIQGKREVYYPFNERVASYGLKNLENGMCSTLQDSHAIYEIIGHIHDNPELLEVK